MTKETSPKLQARIAGFLYLIVIATGIFAEAFVRGKLIAYGDAAATATHILTSEHLFRLGFAADLIAAASYIGVTLIFYVLFKPVSSSLSLLAAFFGLSGSIIMAANLLNQLAAVVILGGRSLTSFGPDQLQTLALVFLKLHAHGYNISIVFFGFYCLLIGYLIVRSSFLPRILGILLAVAGLSSAANSFADFLSLELGATLADHILDPSLVGEGSLALWLCLIGVNESKWQKQRNNAEEFRSSGHE